MKHIGCILLAACLLMLTACTSKKADAPSSSLLSVSYSESSVFTVLDSSSDTALSTSSQSSVSKTQSQTSSGAAAQVSSKAASATANTSSVRQVVRVTIPEGASFMQIANLLDEKEVCTAKAFYTAAQSYTVQSFTIPSSSDRCFKMEGYLFPDTYDFYKDDEPVDVLKKMLNNYAAKSGMPSDKTLILASVIEKEARSDEHMKLVSSVFHNRIKQGMRLDADPTRDYVNNFITGNALLSNTGKYAALYNTYKCALPAGPICSPSKRAIDAAKNPASTEYLYFFFGNDNQNHYSKTLEEHEAQMQKYGVQFGVATD